MSEFSVHHGFCHLCCVNQKLLTTIETNESTKGGKIILDLAHIFSEEDKEVTTIERKTKGVPAKETERILQENDRSMKGLLVLTEWMNSLRNYYET